VTEWLRHLSPTGSCLFSSSACGSGTIQGNRAEYMWKGNGTRRVVEEGREIEDGQRDGHRRRLKDDYEELDRLLEEADRSLGDEDLRGANEALKKAGVKAASMWGEVGKPMLPGHTKRLVGLIWAVQQDLGRLERNSPDELRKHLGELRSRFALEARREVGKTAP
jgi:hypothetical protein